MVEEPLTPAEVEELDGYGRITGRSLLPARAIELWEREILFGRVEPDPRAFYGLSVIAKLLDETSK